MFESYYRRRFADLGAPLADTDGMGAEAVAAALAERGLAVPAALADYYAVAGRHWINRQHNRLYPIGELEWGGDWLVFMEENQNVVFWSVARVDAGEADPVVWQAANAEVLVWSAEPYRVSQFLMAVWRWQLTGEVEVPDPVPGTVVQHVETVDVPVRGPASPPRDV